MADDIAERVARLESKAHSQDSCVALGRLQEKVIAADEISRKFIDLKSYHNDLLETRVRRVEEEVAKVNVQIAPIANLEKQTDDNTNMIGKINVKLALLQGIGILTLGGVALPLILDLIRGTLGK